MLYRRKSELIEAFRFGVDSWPDWFHTEVSQRRAVVVGTKKNSIAQVSQGNTTEFATFGDWIFRNQQAEIKVKRPNAFADMYEAVS